MGGVNDAVGEKGVEVVEVVDEAQVVGEEEGFLVADFLE